MLIFLKSMESWQILFYSEILGDLFLLLLKTTIKEEIKSSRIIQIDFLVSDI